MKKLIDLPPTEIFKILQDLFVSENLKINYLRSVWVNADIYSSDIKKENEIFIHFMIKVENKELKSYTIRNIVTLDELKEKVVKILKTLTI